MQQNFTETNRISLKSTGFHEIQQVFTGFHWNPPDFIWKLPDFIWIRYKKSLFATERGLDWSSSVALSFNERQIKLSNNEEKCRYFCYNTGAHTVFLLQSFIVLLLHSSPDRKKCFVAENFMLTSCCWQKNGIGLCYTKNTTISCAKYLSFSYNYLNSSM